jgi:hypothetical protein
VVVIALVDGAGVDFVIVLQSVVTVAPSFGDDYKHFE